MREAHAARDHAGTRAGLTRRTLLGASAALLASAHAAARSVAGRITRLSPALDALLDPAAPIEIVARGYRWTEGPVWVRRGGYLLFSDVPANVVHRWRPGEAARPFLAPSGFQGAAPAGIREPGANGLAIDRAGALILADSGTRAIVRVDLATRARTILADRFMGRRFNSCNDVAIGRDGSIWFTDPPYGLAEGDASTLKELPFNGVFRRHPNGRIEAIDRTLRRPNGLALSPRGDRLYVACSDEDVPEIRRYDLTRADARGIRFADFAPDRALGLPGLPDGLKVARTGAVFATGPGGVHILAADGMRLGLVSIGRAVANCAFGEDGRTLFMTASDVVARVRLRTVCW